MSMAGIWIRAALRQVVPVIGVYAFDWEAVTVLLFYWLDVVLRVPVWVAFQQDGNRVFDPLATPEKRRRVRRVCTFIGLLPLLMITIALTVLGIKVGGSNIVDLLLRAVPSTARDALMLAAAIATQIIACAYSLRTRGPIPADRKVFRDESKHRWALMFVRVLLLVPLFLIMLIDTRLAVIVLAAAMTVYDANVGMFVWLMGEMFRDSRRDV
jgi:hypothetical protein